MPEKPPRRPIGKRPVTGTPPITDKRPTTGSQPVAGKRATTGRQATVRSTSQRLLETIDPEPVETKATWRQMLLPIAFIAVGFTLWAVGINGAFGSTLFLVRCVGIVLAVYGIVAWARARRSSSVLAGVVTVLHSSPASRSAAAWPLVMMRKSIPGFTFLKARCMKKTSSGPSSMYKTGSLIAR